MNRKTIAIIALGLLIVLAGCAGSTSQEQKQENADSFENNTFTFTKPAAQSDKVWTCIGHERYSGTAGDEQIECELVEAEDF